MMTTIASSAINGINLDESRGGSSSTTKEPNPICSNGAGSSSSQSHKQRNSSSSGQKKHHVSSNTRNEYILNPGEDDSKKPLLPKSTSSSKSKSIAEKKHDPIILQDMTQLQQHLELMHDRCIARNLRAAGLGGFEVEDEVIYGVLDANAHMTTGETMLTATVLYLKEPDRLHHYVSILLNDGADVNERDAEGKTALMHAIISGRDKAAKAILRHEKSDLLVRDNEGNTALMHAAAVGSTSILYYYFKALRKREKQQSQKAPASQSASASAGGESQKSSTTPLQQQQSSAQIASSSAAPIVEEKNSEVRSSQELWSMLRSDDPLDLQNTKGETAHVLASKNGHHECANMISDEKMKRAKEMNKRLNALQHHRSGSPGILRFAKRSAKKYLQHYGSFDSVYFDREDESDDELMLGGNANNNGMRRSRTADPKLGVHQHGSGKKSHSITTSSNISQQNQNQNQNHPPNNKGFLLRLNKRFQSNPDLFRVKTNSSLPTEELDKGMVGSEERHGEQMTKETDLEKGHQAMAKSISGGLKQQQGTSQSHQPVIKGQYQRRQSTSAPVHSPHKRNLAEKLMSFLRLRPKYYVPSSSSDMTLCASTSTSQGRDYKRSFSKKQSPPHPNFSSIEQGLAEENHGASLRKGVSQPDISPASQRQAARRGSAVAFKAPTLAPAVTADSQHYDPKQRRSVDLSAMPSLHNQFLADSSMQNFADSWNCGNLVEEETADQSLVTITTLPTSPPPMTPGASTLLKQSSNFNFPPLPS